MTRQRRPIIFQLHGLSLLLALEQQFFSHSVWLSIAIVLRASIWMCLQVQRRTWEIRSAFIGVFDFVVLLHLDLELSDFSAYIDRRFCGFASIVLHSVNLVKFI